MASCSNKRSALFHIFRMYSLKQNEQFTMELKLMYKGFKRQIAKEKENGNSKIQTSKTPISFALYCCINEFFLRKHDGSNIICSSFYVSYLELGCRALNTVTIHLHHLAWTDNCLSVFFVHMKNDQLEDRKRDPRHIYANPHNVLVCPITALQVQ